MKFEKSYYVMDVKGNYYKNNQGQLILADSEEDAMILPFPDANRLVNENENPESYFIIPADIDYDEDLDVDNTDISAIRELTEEELADAGMDLPEEYDLSGIDWVDYLRKIHNIVIAIGKYKKEMRLSVGIVDKKICDVLHYIELYDTNDSKASSLVELLKVCRAKRRFYKDEIFRASAFKNSIGAQNGVEAIINAIKAIDGLDNRKYKPREYKELFKNNPVVGESEHTFSFSWEEDISVDEAFSTGFSREETEMEYIKKETPFDGQDNDWLAFAMKQAEFYMNAQQYIINNKMDIKEIDTNIERLMEEMEQANCNVAQGYKMFKKLKDLRLARKKKKRELDAVRILTECFDITVMKTISKRNTNDLDRLLNGTEIEFEAEEAGKEEVGFINTAV